MNSVPAISVVIPLYNKVKYIRRALDSVLNQTSADLEVIVVDDGSTDGGGHVVLRQHDGRVRLIRQGNKGVSVARNRGVSEARADLIAFLDADDEWLPEHLETIRRLAERHPECGAYATVLCRVNAKGIVERFSYRNIPAPPWEGVIPNYFRAGLGKWPLTSSTAVVWKRVFDDVGLFPVGERAGEDLDVWCRIALKYPVAFSNSAGAIYHMDANYMAERLIGPEHCYVRLFRTLEDSLQSGVFPPGVTRKDIIDYRNKQLLDLVTLHLFRGDRRHARVLLGRATPTRTFCDKLVKGYILSYAPPPMLSAAVWMKRSLRPSRRET